MPALTAQSVVPLTISISTQPELGNLLGYSILGEVVSLDTERCSHGADAASRRESAQANAVGPG